MVLCELFVLDEAMACMLVVGGAGAGGGLRPFRIRQN